MALVRQFGKGPAQVVRGDADAQFLAVALYHFEDRLRGHARAGELARFVHRPHDFPVAKPAAAVQRSTEALAQAGMGTVRTRLPFPTRSTSTQRPSRG